MRQKIKEKTSGIKAKPLTQCRKIFSMLRGEERQREVTKTEWRWEQEERARSER